MEKIIELFNKVQTDRKRVGLPLWPDMTDFFVNFKLNSNYKILCAVPSNQGFALNLIDKEQTKVFITIVPNNTYKILEFLSDDEGETEEIEHHISSFFAQVIIKKSKEKEKQTAKIREARQNAYSMAYA